MGPVDKWDISFLENFCFTVNLIQLKIYLLGLQIKFVLDTRWFHMESIFERFHDFMQIPNLC
jgi:hypothetical protein